MSTAQYATRYRIKPATAAKAFAFPIDERIVHERRSVGTFVFPGRVWSA